MGKIINPSKMPREKTKKKQNRKGKRNRKKKKNPTSVPCGSKTKSLFSFLAVSLGPFSTFLVSYSLPLCSKPSAAGKVSHTLNFSFFSSISSLCDLANKGSPLLRTYVIRFGPHGKIYTSLTILRSLNHISKVSFAI